MRLLPLLFLLTASLVLSTSVGADTPLQHKGYAFTPKAMKNAKLYARIPFLQPERDWERIDIYRPDGATEKLPCVMIIWGGGYGDKNMPWDAVQPLLDAGFVVAVPDYALQLRHPEVLAAWDTANAIRFVRKNAATYQIDPERIGVWGFSAGGWIVQNLCYSNDSEMSYSSGTTTWDRTGKTPAGFAPFIEPTPLYAEHSDRVQAVVSDWGAGKLLQKQSGDNNTIVYTPAPRLSADDPPLLTCYSGKPRQLSDAATTFLSGHGVLADPVFLEVKNTHVPKLTTPGWTADGRDTTWVTAVIDFFERQLKRMSVATAPEIRVADGILRMLSVHPGGAIHYTTDGSSPNVDSPRYTTTLELPAGTLVKAMAVASPLQPSPVTTRITGSAEFRPKIHSAPNSVVATVGQPFALELQAEGDVNWFICGRLGSTFRHYKDQRFNPPRHIPWLEIDAVGTLRGTPPAAGVYPVVVSAWRMTGQSPKQPGELAADARLIVIKVQ